MANTLPQHIKRVVDQCLSDVGGRLIMSELTSAEIKLARTVIANAILSKNMKEEAQNG